MIRRRWRKFAGGPGGACGWFRALAVTGLAVLAILTTPAVPAVAQVSPVPLAGAARLDPGASGLEDRGAQALGVTLVISQPVPWRLRLLDAPPRLVVEARQIDWGAGPAGWDAGRFRALAGLQALQGGDGWSRLVLEMGAPFAVVSAGMAVNEETGAARITLRLGPATAEDFAASLSPGPDPLAPDPLAPAADGTTPDPDTSAPRPVVIVLDPGHGGSDPGAEHGGLRESDLMLTFARELREALRRAGGFEVVLTRDADIFLSLAARLRVARAANADLFLSLHADALDGGQASGATIYTLADEATDARAAALADRHDRADLLGGVEPGAADDLISGLLVALAEVETRPRAGLLATALAGSIAEAGLQLHPRPLQAAAFRVLTAPDTPSVLVELGFLSSPRDRARLTDAEWRGRMAEAIVAGVQAYLAQDAAEAPLRRR